MPADTPDTHGRVAQDIGHVNGYFLIVLAEQLGDGQPIGGHWRIAVETGIEPDIPMQLFACFERRVRDAVDTHKFRGNALAHFGIMMGGPQDGETGMRM